MAPPRFRISTRQKSDELVTLGQDDLLATGAIFTSAVVRVSGYSGISILAIANASFTIRVEEACESDGDFALTQTFLSAADPSGLHFVCQRVVPCGIFAQVILENTSGAAQTTLSMCTTGLPEGGGGGVGPPGPPGPVGPPGVQTDHAATFVVNPAGGADFTTIAAALAALPAAGGCLFLREGTYTLAATNTLPDKPVTIRGCGRGSTVLDLGANAIAAFTIGFDREYGFSGFSILGTDIAGQQGFRYTSTGTRVNGFGDLELGRAGGTQIERAFSASGVFSREVIASDLDVNIRSVAAGRFYELEGTLTASAVVCTGSAAILSQAGVSDGPMTLAVNCTFSNGSGGTNSAFGVNSFLSGCDLVNAGNWRLKGGCTITGGHLAMGTISTLTGGQNTITGLVSDSTTIPQIDFGTLGTGDNVLTGCTLMENGSNFAVRVSTTENVVTGNKNCRVLENSAADFNRYSNNEGFDGSTIIGVSSLVENENFRNVKTWGATGDGATDDAAAIQAAIDELPVAGGVLYFPEGTYLIGTTLTLPAKPVKIIGAGRDATAIDLGSSVIAAFTIASSDPFSFSEFDITGDGSAGQIAFDVTAAGSTFPSTAITRVDINSVDVQVNINVAAFPTIEVFECVWVGSVLASARTWTGPGEFRAIRCQFSNGGILGSPSIQFTNCLVSLANGGTVQDAEVENTEFTIAGAVPLSINSAGSASCNLIGCNFRSVVATRAIDIVLDGDGVISGCVFEGTFSGEAIRIAGSDYSINNNIGCRVLEIGGADNNHYSNNEGFEGSTIIGADSVVDDANTRTVTTTPVTLDRDDYTVLVDSSGGNRVINLPTAASAIYKIYEIKKIDAANAVTIDPSGAELIDGVATKVLANDNEAVIIQSDGTGWHILACCNASDAPTNVFCFTTTPATLVANANNYNPGNGTCYRLSASGATRDITGLAPTGGNDDGAGSGRSVRLINVGAEDIRIMHQNAGSAAANRFINESGSDFTISTNQGVEAFYDPVDTRWRVFEV